MRRISLAALALVCSASAALAYDPCFGPRQTVIEVQSRRSDEARLRADFASGVRVAPIGAEAPRNRGAQLAAEQQAKATIAAACDDAAGRVAQ